MDFQLTRNLSAINRAQQLATDTLLYLGECADCLNREVILPVSASDEAEQLLDAARANLLQVQTILNEHHRVVERRLRAAQVAYLLERPRRRTSETSSSAPEPAEESQQNADGNSDVTQKGVPDDGHSYDGTVVRGGIGDHRRDD